jgi:hypothetical protein
MKSFAVSAAALLAAIVPSALAQTHTNCNPLNTTGCPEMQALGGNATFFWNKTGIPTGSKVWEKQNQGTIDWSEDAKGAKFTIERSGDSPMVQSKFYMLFGLHSSIVFLLNYLHFIMVSTTMPIRREIPSYSIKSPQSLMQNLQILCRKNDFLVQSLELRNDVYIISLQKLERSSPLVPATC